MNGNIAGVRGRRGRSRAPWAIVAAIFVLVVTGCEPTPPDHTALEKAMATLRHVFVINLENKDYNQTWGDGSPAAYLAKTLRAQGVLLTQYYGIAHHSAGNYLAQISGQGANEASRNDCTSYAPLEQTGTASPGQVLGSGCVYPASVPTLAGQLTAAGKTWKGYMEDMPAPCEHPQLGGKDNHQSATAGDQYATRHNPFVYFQSIPAPECQSNDVPFDGFASDLRSVSTTPNLSYISPNLCNDGHDIPCVDGRPGGLESIDAWLRQQVPAILNSPAYRQDGMLVITFDESEGNSGGPANLLPGGTAGGRTGTLVISPFTKGGTAANTPYNHYSLLATIEDLFSLPRLGYASAPDLKPFGADVFNASS